MMMISGMLAVIIPIAIITFIIVAIVRSVKKDGSEESFQDVIRTMYIYLVMIIFLGMFVVSTISLFNSCMELLLPETVQNSYQSAITIRNRTIADLTTNIAMLFISVPMFAYYSTQAKKDHREKMLRKEAKIEQK